jgi:hypothetical protein
MGMKTENIQARIDEIGKQMDAMGCSKLMDGSDNCYTTTYTCREQQEQYEALREERWDLQNKVRRLNRRHQKKERMTTIAKLEASGEAVGEELRQDDNDCTVQATRYCLGKTYDEAYNLLKSLGRKDKHGCPFWNLAPKLGLEVMYVSPTAARRWAKVDDARIAKMTPAKAESWRGLKTMMTLAADHKMKLGEALAKYSTGNWIIGVKRHVLAVVDGKNMDGAGTRMNESVWYVYRPSIVETSEQTGD